MPDPLRRSVVQAARAMQRLGLTSGVSGNVSVRHGSLARNAMLITPSATPYEAMGNDDLAEVTLDGSGAWTGPRKPSTEWRFHDAIFRARSDVGAVVHTHSPYATALSLLRADIPAAHYMVAVFGGGDVRCAPYATFGSATLAAHAVTALEGRFGCLLANHGAITVGPTVERALWLAGELEALARQYLLARAVGEPVLLTAAEVAEAAGLFSGYGQG